MNVLQINRFLYTEGGSERYFFDVSNLMRKYHNTIAEFSMADKKNIFTEWSKYFVSNISLDNISARSLLKIASRLIYSTEAQSKLSSLLCVFRPDIAHIHIFSTFLSPSIFVELHRRNIPILQTLHDYQQIAPTRGSLFHGSSICEITKKQSYYKAIYHKCIRSSYIASGAFAFSCYINKALKIYNRVDYFIAPSLFLKHKYIEYGFESNKIIVLPYFVNYEQYSLNHKNNKGNYISYFGRLSPEKGVDNLIQALKSIPTITLYIAGKGSREYEQKLKKESAKSKNIRFVGFQTEASLKKLIQNCRFTVLPSVWYENLPMSILESYASFKPVIASNIGGIPELVKDGYNGFLVEPGNSDDLADKISKLWNNPSLCRKMGKNAREYVEKNFSPEEHYEKLMTIYNKAIQLHK